jgi:hypothetical protein
MIRDLYWPGSQDEGMLRMISFADIDSDFH